MIYFVQSVEIVIIVDGVESIYELIDVSVEEIELETSQDV